MARKKIGELLLERGVISLEQLNAALAHQRQYGHRLGAALVAKGFLTEAGLVKVLGEALNLKVVDLGKETPDWSAVHLLRPRFCEANDLFPLGLEDQRGRKLLTVAMADPLNLPAIEEMEFTTGCKVAPVLATHSSILDAIRRFYFRNQPTAAATASSSEKMQIVRPGGFTEEVDTSTAEPVEDTDVVELAEEVTERTALADLIKKREEQRRARAASPPPPVSKKTQLDDDLGFLIGTEVAPGSDERLEKLERKFWAVMRILAKKGVLTKDEFLEQLDD